jgi:hypothetical protein
MSTLIPTQYTINESITVNFTLSGTMSPENLNAAPNVVIAQLSDANGSFDNPTELGRVTTNTSGSITGQIPNVSSGQHYKVRVVSTNYPMIGENIQEISIVNTTSLQELQSTCSLFPNPFTSTLSITAEKAIESISIYDAFGRLVKKQPASTKKLSLDLTGLSQGIYLLQVDYGDSRSLHRIVKSE